MWGFMRYCINSCMPPILVVAQLHPPSDPFATVLFTSDRIGGDERVGKPSWQAVGAGGWGGEQGYVTGNSGRNANGLLAQCLVCI